MTMKAERLRQDRLFWLAGMVTIGKRVDNVDTTWIRRHADEFMIAMSGIEEMRENEMARIFKEKK